MCPDAPGAMAIHGRQAGAGTVSRKDNFCASLRILKVYMIALKIIPDNLRVVLKEDMRINPYQATSIRDPWSA
jgi:hypothetical protein